MFNGCGGAVAVVAARPAGWLPGLDAIWAAISSSPPGDGSAPSPAPGDSGPVREETVDARIVALVELAKDGDREAFGQLYDAYVDTVHRYLFVRVGQRALAEDLTSETFVRAFVQKGGQ